MEKEWEGEYDGVGDERGDEECDGGDEECDGGVEDGRGADDYHELEQMENQCMEKECKGEYYAVGAKCREEW